MSIFTRSLPLAAALLLATSFPAFAETVSLHGSTTVAATVITPQKAEIEKAAGVTLEVIANGSGRGVADLLDKKADMAMISAPLNEVVDSLKAKTPSLDTTALQAHQIGEARVAFVVHPSNAVKKLTRAQLTQVLSGKAKNWKELGGADQPITVVVESKGGGLRTVVEHALLDKQDIAGDKREVPNSPQVVKVVAQLAGGLGIAPSSAIGDASMKVEIDSPVVQPLILVTNGAPTPVAVKILAAATEAAKSK